MAYQHLKGTAPSSVISAIPARWEAASAGLGKKKKGWGGREEVAKALPRME